MFQELQIFAFVCTYWDAGCLFFFRLCGSDFGITPVDDITNGITWAVLLPHSTYFIRQFLVFVLFIGYCFVEIMCIRDSCVYRKGILCFS